MMTDKQLKKIKVFFITVNAAYQISSIYSLRDDKNFQNTKEVVKTILEILSHKQPCEESLSVYLDKFEKCLEIETNIKAPNFSAGGIIPTV